MNRTLETVIRLALARRTDPFQFVRLVKQVREKTPGIEKTDSFLDGLLDNSWNWDDPLYIEYLVYVGLSFADNPTKNDDNTNKNGSFHPLIFRIFESVQTHGTNYVVLLVLKLIPAAYGLAHKSILYMGTNVLLANQEEWNLPGWLDYQAQLSVIIDNVISTTMSQQFAMEDNGFGMDIDMNMNTNFDQFLPASSNDISTHGSNRSTNGGEIDSDKNDLLSALGDHITRPEFPPTTASLSMDIDTLANNLLVKIFKTCIQHFRLNPETSILSQRIQIASDRCLTIPVLLSSTDSQAIIQSNGAPLELGLDGLTPFQDSSKDIELLREYVLPIWLLPSSRRINNVIWLLTKSELVCTLYDPKLTGEVVQLVSQHGALDSQTAIRDLVLMGLDAFVISQQNQEPVARRLLYKNFLLKKLPLLLVEIVGDICRRNSITTSPLESLEGQESSSSSKMKDLLGIDLETLLPEICSSLDPSTVAVLEASSSPNIREAFLAECIQAGLLPKTGTDFADFASWSRSLDDDQQSSFGLQSPNELFDLIARDDSSDGVLLEYLNNPSALSCIKQKNLFVAFAEIVKFLCETKQCNRLKDICARAASKPTTIDLIGFYVDPKSVILPIVQVLDNRSAENEDRFQDSYMEFGCLTIFLLSYFDRYHLSPADVLATGGFEPQSDFVESCLFGLGVPLSDERMSPEQMEHLGAWLAAFYGSDGISDELLSQCSPCNFFQLVSTICKQSMLAVRRGVIDQMVLKGGLEYLVHPALIGAMVSAVRYLTNELFTLRDIDTALIILQSLLVPVSLPEESRLMHEALLAISAPAVYDALRDIDRHGVTIQDPSIDLNAVMTNVGAYLPLHSRNFQFEPIGGMQADLPRRPLSLFSMLRNQIGLLTNWCQVVDATNKAKVPSLTPVQPTRTRVGDSGLSTSLVGTPAGTTPLGEMFSKSRGVGVKIEPGIHDSVTHPTSSSSSSSSPLGLTGPIPMYRPWLINNVISLHGTMSTLKMLGQHLAAADAQGQLVHSLTIISSMILHQHAGRNRVSCSSLPQEFEPSLWGKLKQLDLGASQANKHIDDHSKKYLSKLSIVVAKLLAEGF